MVTVATNDQVRLLLDEVVDPEIPVLTIADLGVLRDVAVSEGSVLVTITPTYSGCPAMDLIRSEIASTLEANGFSDYSIETVFSPAWTTDWMTEEAKVKLRDYGIAGPAPVEPVVSGIGYQVSAAVCPLCRSDETRMVSEFGSTACKALMVCSSCGEPFDLFKAL